MSGVLGIWGDYIYAVFSFMFVLMYLSSGDLLFAGVWFMLLIQSLLMFEWRINPERYPETFHQGNFGSSLVLIVSMLTAFLLMGFAMYTMAQP